MPSRTNEDKIEELTKFAASVNQQIQALDGQLKGFVGDKAEIGKEISAVGKTLVVLEQQLKDLRIWKESFGSIDQVKIENALLRKELEDLKKWRDEVKAKKDEWGKRLWAMAGPLVGAIAGWALGYFSRPN